MQSRVGGRTLLSSVLSCVLFPGHLQREADKSRPALYKLTTSRYRDPFPHSLLTSRTLLESLCRYPSSAHQTAGKIWKAFFLFVVVFLGWLLCSGFSSRWTSRPVIVTIRDNGDYIGVLHHISIISLLQGGGSTQVIFFTHWQERTSEGQGC